jgi:hypothetical protein
MVMDGNQSHLIITLFETVLLPIPARSCRVCHAISKTCEHIILKDLAHASTDSSDDSD